MNLEIFVLYRRSIVFVQLKSQNIILASNIELSGFKQFFYSGSRPLLTKRRGGDTNIIINTNLAFSTAYLRLNFLVFGWSCLFFCALFLLKTI